jgi:SAM-dependent methyltransferase
MKTPGWLRNWRLRQKIKNFQERGSNPWTPGYEEYKRQQISRALQAGCFDPNHLPENFGYGLDERIVEIPWLFSRLQRGQGRFLDAGSALNQELYLTHSMLVAKKIDIVTLAPEDYCAWRSGVSYLFADLRCLPYRDAWFDEIASISTLEHIGLDNTRLYTTDPGYRESSPAEASRAVGELFRVLRPGGKLWLTVPVGQPANLGWLQIFAPAGLEAMVSAFAFTIMDRWYYQYTPQGWRKAQVSEVSGATYFDWHSTKIYDSDKAAAARAVGCLELVKS